LHEAKRKWIISQHYGIQRCSAYHLIDFLSFVAQLVVQQINNPMVLGRKFTFFHWNKHVLHLWVKYHAASNERKQISLQGKHKSNIFVF